MITMDDMVDLLVAEPFRPFRLRLCDGAALAVDDADALGVGATFVKVQVREPGSGRRAWRRLGLDELQAVEPAAVPPR